MTRSATSPPAHAALAALRERFRASSGGTFEAFERIAGRLAQAPDAPDVLDALRRELHRVQGTAGTYGYMEASHLAERLGRRAAEWARDAALERDERRTVVEHFVRALRLAFDAVDRHDTPAAPARRRVALVGLPGGIVSALRVEGMLHRWSLEVLAPHECDAVRPRAHAPHVVVTTTALAARLGGGLDAAGVPVIALEDSRDASPVPGAARGADAGMTVLDAGVEPSTLAALVERLALRSTNAGATILVVDDDPAVLAMVRWVVESDGTRVATLHDPAQLDATLRDVRPSLVLMDVQMRQHDGIALVRALRARDDGRALPIVLISSDTRADVRQRAYEAGADEFIPKPIVAAELLARLRGRLERQRLQRLAEGLHPGTGLPLPPRTERAVSAWLADPAHAGAVSVALVRPSAVGDAEGEAAAAWLREAQRIAAAMPGGAAGLYDGLALLVAMPNDAATLAARLATIAGEGEAAWHAGVAAAGDVGSRDLPALRAAAAEACDAATEAPGARVVAWSRANADVAPDVIIVEDDPALADMLQFALRSAGYSYRTFRTGTEALDGMRRMRSFGRRPLVLLDVDLPGMDGHSLHERLRTERPGAFAVVFATVHGAEGEQLRALRSGALDWVVKPLSLRVLMAKIPVWLGHAARC